MLFDHAIDDWVDLGPDPIRRRHVGQIYADHVGAAYAAWKWLSDRAGTDVDTPPAEQPAPEALALEIGVTDWTELMVALLTVGRAQSLLFAELAATGGDTARRAFDRVGRDFAGHAALAFLELRRGTFIDGEAAKVALDRLLPATRGPARRQRPVLPASRRTSAPCWSRSTSPAHSGTALPAPTVRTPRKTWRCAVAVASWRSLTEEAKGTPERCARLARRNWRSLSGIWRKSNARMRAAARPVRNCRIALGWVGSAGAFEDDDGDLPRRLSARTR